MMATPTDPTSSSDDLVKQYKAMSDQQLIDAIERKRENMHEYVKHRIGNLSPRSREMFLVITDPIDPNENMNESAPGTYAAVPSFVFEKRLKAEAAAAAAAPAGASADNGGDDPIYDTFQPSSAAKTARAGKELAAAPDAKATAVAASQLQASAIAAAETSAAAAATAVVAPTTTTIASPATAVATPGAGGAPAAPAAAPAIPAAAHSTPAAPCADRRSSDTEAKPTLLHSAESEEEVLRRTVMIIHWNTSGVAQYTYKTLDAKTYGEIKPQMRPVRTASAERRDRNARRKERSRKTSSSTDGRTEGKHSKQGVSAAAGAGTKQPDVTNSNGLVAGETIKLPPRPGKGSKAAKGFKATSAAQKDVGSVAPTAMKTPATMSKVPGTK